VSFFCRQPWATAALAKAGRRGILTGSRAVRAEAPTVSRFPGASSAFTTTLDLHEPKEKRPVYRVMNEQGQWLKSNYKPTLKDPEVVHMYRTMVTLHSMDQIFYDAQRQGRISFYMTNTGEESIQIGTENLTDNALASV
jgi:2-oxoisovalerate dehydrogenase E1 component alpha subunit